jgi:hypothetical protein
VITEIKIGVTEIEAMIGILRAAAVVSQQRTESHNNSYNIPIHEVIREVHDGHKKRQQLRMVHRQHIVDGMMVKKNS